MKSLREKGNELYNNGEPGKAMELYEEAVKAGDDIARANISAAAYECGLYDRALIEAKSAMEFISREDQTIDAAAVARFRTLSKRAARIEILRRNWDEAEYHLERSKDVGRKQYELFKFGRRCGVFCSEDVGELYKFPLMEGMFRSPPVTKKDPFIPWSHQKPWSMMDGPMSWKGSEYNISRRRIPDYASKSQKTLALDVKRRASKDGDPIRLFVGGAEDGRVVFETLRDIYNKSHLQRNPPQVHILINDTREEVLARIIVMLVLFYELGGVKIDTTDMSTNFATSKKGRSQAKKACAKSQQRFEKDKEHAKALDMATMVYHAYVSPFVLPHHHQRLFKLVSSLAEESVPYSWISMLDPNSGELLRDVYAFWAKDSVDSKTMDRYVTITEEEKKRRDDVFQRKWDAHWNAIKGNADGIPIPGTDMEFPVPPLSVLKNRGRGKDGMERAFEGLDQSMDPLVVKMLKEKCNALGRKPRSHWDNLKIPTVHSLYEEDLLRKERTVAPPVELWAKYSKHVEITEKSAQEGSRKRLSTNRLWKPNITAIPMDINEVSGSVWLDEDNYAPNLVFDNIANIARTHQDGRKFKRCWFDHCSPWFTGVAEAVRYLVDTGALHLKFHVGDMHEASLRQERASFDCIWLSNRPEYTHFLGMAVFFAPLLRRKDRPGFIIHEIETTIDMYDHLMHYIHSSTYLTSVEECEKALGLKFSGGALHGPRPYWSDVPKMTGAGLPRSEFHAWLYRILLSILFPPMVDGSQYRRELYPLTLVSFFEILVRCVEVGYPKHWVAFYIESIFKHMWDSTAIPPTSSPCHLHHTAGSLGGERARMHIRPMMPEFRAVCCYYMKKRLPFGIFLDCSRPRWYTWPPEVINALKVERRGNDYMAHPCVGLAMINPKYVEILTVLDLENTLRECRNDYALFSKKNIFLHTVVKWVMSRKKKELAVYMTDHDNSIYIKKNYVAYLYRTDNYVPLYPCFPLPMSRSVPRSKVNQSRQAVVSS